MDTLKGKKIMVWTFMGNARMYTTLRNYGDRISQIGLFSFKVRATGEIYETGVSISSTLCVRIVVSEVRKGLWYNIGKRRKEFLR